MQILAASPRGSRVLQALALWRESCGSFSHGTLGIEGRCRLGRELWLSRTRASHARIQRLKIRTARSHSRSVAAPPVSPLREFCKEGRTGYARVLSPNVGDNRRPRNASRAAADALGR